MIFLHKTFVLFSSRNIYKIFNEDAFTWEV